ncbi:hypothetical protein DYD21_04300 [Rhodohalobacter sp. SW132]|uniref:hypothetical protein n=1 Tax=Rhodohalobacter sp. SW132 TaxID=2293433 RepID=UPI000E23E92B|nr:hypothetical protein [Rhodohalobacter sp. SW132]REL39183.1 hypothetical protein DYD21_04300 [Rhodohalobacter sp. SW132]
MKFKIPSILLLLFSLSFFSCASAQTFTTEAIIHQPAGSSITVEVGNQTESAENRDQPLYSGDDVLLYLPAPANIGFIQSPGGSVETVILAPAIRADSEIEIIPIAMMEFGASDRIQRVILSIPADPSLQVIKSPSMQQLRLNYPGVIEILTTWFTNAYSDRITELLDVKDEKKTVQYLKNHSL